LPVLGDFGQSPELSHLGLVRANGDKVIKTAWLFPNTHAVDPLRDMILLHTWPVDGGFPQ
jgi:hypothetical protein